LKENSEQTQEPLREGEREDFSSDEAHGTETTLGSPRAGLAADEKAASDETIKKSLAFFLTSLSASKHFK